MVLVRLEVAGDDDAVGELPAGEGVLRLLAVGDGRELHEDLPAAGNLNGERTEVKSDSSTKLTHHNGSCFL